MTSLPNATFAHVGLYVTDLERMQAFYTRLLGMVVTDRGDLGAVRLVFLSRDTREHHQIVLVTGRPHTPGFSVLNQISLRVPDVTALRTFHAHAIQCGAQDIQPVTHGNAVSVYLRDPEGNRIELYTDTPWYVRQPARVPIDLAQSDEGLWQHIESVARALPGFKPVAEWRHDMERLIGSSSSSDPARHKQVIERYFHEVLDQKKLEVLPELMAADVVLHRPGLDVVGLEAAVERLRATLAHFISFRSELSGLIAENDVVSVRVAHRTRVRPHTFRTHAGDVPIAQEQPLNWDAIVQFRFAHGRIVEEWVMRDELAMVIQTANMTITPKIPSTSSHVPL